MPMVNTTKITAQELQDKLEEAGVEARPHPWLDDCLLLSRTGDLEQLMPFKRAVLCAGPGVPAGRPGRRPQPGMRVLDCCAAPEESPSLRPSRWRISGEVISCDLHPHKKKLIQAGADRLGLDIITPQTADGKVFHPEWERAFDLVLVDAPCSGLGVIRKKPDIRYKDPAPLEGPSRGPAGHPGQCRPVCTARRDAALLHLHPAASGERGGHWDLFNKGQLLPKGALCTA
ncbi:MAG: hypothetical protein V8S34_08055 [Lawsonibacter sp.]